MSNYNFKNLVFEGGGVKGIAYLGALNILNSKGILDNIERIGGTSAGAINAVLLGLNYTPNETKKILWELNFNHFKDDSRGFRRDFKRLRKKFGWYKGDYFREWISQIIEAKTGNRESTFADLELMKDKKGFKSIYFIGTNLSTSFSEVFSAEHTPRMCIADAVRISMSIPLFFASIKSQRGDIYVDGGVLNNYPVKLFDRRKYVSGNKAVTTEYYDVINANISKIDRPISEYVYNKETLGFRLDTKQELAIFRDHAEPQRKNIKNLYQYTRSLINTLMEAQLSQHLHSDDWARTIYIDTIGVETTDFDLTDSKKKALVASGKKGTNEYFKWFDDAPKTKTPNK